MDVLDYARRVFRRNCRTRNQVALAWEAALGITLDAPAMHALDDEREHLETERMMRQRYGALDRRG